MYQVLYIYNIFISLDGDNIKITSPFTGEVRYRDIVQFVHFNEYENDGTKLAAKVLEEIPTQIEDYFHSG